MRRIGKWLRGGWFIFPGFFIFTYLHVSYAAESLPSIPHKRMLDDPLEFTGREGPVGDPMKLGEIRIGFFAPVDGSDPVGDAMWKGASLAVEEANRAGGYQQVPYRLISRWADDPWGAGSKEMIRLVYEDRVWAVIGSIDGDTTHIAEQIVTKARLPLISPVSSDPTLTFIRIPWIFRLAPDDRSQANVLVSDGIIQHGCKRIGLITASNHDGRIAAKELKDALGKNNIAPVCHLILPPDPESFGELADKLQAFHCDTLALAIPRDSIGPLLKSFKNNNIKIPVFFPWIPGADERELKKLYEGMLVTIRPFEEDTLTEQYSTFLLAYQNRFGESPNACAVYAYDAVNIIGKAIQSQGLNRARIRRALADMKCGEGVTGKIVWDHGGGNPGRPLIYKITAP